MTIRREQGGRFAALRPRPDARGVLVPAILLFAWALAMTLGCSGCGSEGAPTITVNSLEDPDQPPPGTVTLRSALRDVPDGGRIVFDRSLNGGAIGLRLVGADNTVLKAEVYSGMTFLGYQERNFGRSALYVRKNVTIDASDLPDGITIRWVGDGSTQARVLAVYGDLTMRNVTVSGGRSCAEPIPGGTQPYTLARGGGIAVWGTATLQRCTVSENRCEGDNTASRDRGAFGGGIYADGLQLEDCIVSGNSVVGYGAAGGGIYSVGGGDNPGGRGNDTRLSRCAITGNRVTGQHAYGGGVFTLSGGPNNLATMTLSSCTVARNLVEDNPALPEAGQYYYRGGGVYVGGGSLSMTGCTIVENEVTGRAATFGGKPNMGGGGIAATIGNAHTVEEMRVSQSIVAGNRAGGAADDLFSGSLLHFYSDGYNRIGRIDFSQILVPIPAWQCLSRKHWPKAGDLDNVALADVVDVANAGRHDRIRSAGTDNGALAVLWYPPLGGASDQVPASGYQVDNVVLAEYAVKSGAKDDFLPVVLDTLTTGSYGAILGSDFGANYRASFEAAYGISLDNVVWYQVPRTWPSDPRNAPWINFWRGLDNAIAGRLGSAGLGDDFWGTFGTGPLTDNVTIFIYRPTRTAALAGPDQLGRTRPAGPKGDIGSIER